MKIPYQYILKIDPQVKAYFKSTASKYGVKAEFQGYWIEQTEDSISGPFPRFNSFEEWGKQNPYSSLDYIRYFFELTIDEKKHIATLSIDIKDRVGFNFSIEEFGDFHFIESTKEILEESDFHLLENYIKQKFVQ